MSAMSELLQHASEATLEVLHSNFHTWTRRSLGVCEQILAIDSQQSTPKMSNLYEMSEENYSAYGYSMMGFANLILHLFHAQQTS